MVRELDPTRRLDAEVRRLIRHRLGDAAAALQAVIAAPPCGDERAGRDGGHDGADTADAVHAARRQCKEVRALVRLLDLDDGAGLPLDRAVRTAARTLAPVRDAQVAAELTARTAPPGDPVAAPAPDVITEEHRRAIERAVAELELAAESTATIRVDDPGAALRRGLQRTYGRSRRAYARARRRPNARRLHRWRTWNKRLWYQVRFLSVTAPSLLTPLAELLDVVGETLGDAHDRDIFVSGEHGRTLDGAQREAIAREREALSARALRWGATIHAESPSAFADRLVRLWDAAAEQGPEPAR